jgi:uncharacterized membrane protein YozB (DUF420 family)
MLHSMRIRFTLFSCLLLASLALSCAPREGQLKNTGSDLAASARSDASFGAIAEFEFEERRGTQVTRESLLGQPWLAGFIFTRCSTICPALTQELSHIHQALEGLDARVVALSVDPEHDTPEVLTEYASHFTGGQADNWLFLRGPEEVTYELIRKSFKLGIERVDEENPGLAVSHSSLLVAVDGEGQIRGFYSGVNSESVGLAIARMRFLAGAPRESHILPTINASLNALSAFLLVLGFAAIRRGEKVVHARFMRSAFLCSAVFLACYLYYHFVVIPSIGGPVKFSGEGPAKSAYLVLLLTHVLGAIINLPMVLRTLWLAHTEQWEAHKKWARWTFPLWLYVSVTGVMVYFALYVL